MIDPSDCIAKICLMEVASVVIDCAGLADEVNLYKKFLGVVTEMGADMGLAAQGDEMARDRLTTSMQIFPVLLCLSLDVNVTSS